MPPLREPKTHRRRRGGEGEGSASLLAGQIGNLVPSGWAGPHPAGGLGDFLPEHGSCRSRKNQSLCSLRGETLTLEHVWIVRVPELRVNIGPENQRRVNLRVTEPGNV